MMTIGDSMPLRTKSKAHMGLNARILDHRGKKIMYRVGAREEKYAPRVNLGFATIVVRCTVLVLIRYQQPPASLSASFMTIAARYSSPILLFSLVLW